MKFYRVCNTNTKQGLWYDQKGEFTGYIHNEFSFCKNNDLKMDFDPILVGWLSATDSLETLFHWFSKEDIIKLQNFGYCIHIYETDDYSFYERFQHLIIRQSTSQLIDVMWLTDNELTVKELLSIEK